MKEQLMEFNEIRKFIREVIVSENIVTPPDIPGTMNFWHGGNLDVYDDLIAQKNGRYEYGPGLYLITHYDTAKKYAKGSRKLYLISVATGTDINDAMIPVENVKEFIQSYVKTNMRKEAWERVQRFIQDNQVKAYGLNNIMINMKAIKPAHTPALRQFYIDNGIDYEIIDRAFGWNAKMMVLYNMQKIVNTIRIMPGDKLSTYEL